MNCAITNTSTIYPVREVKDSAITFGISLASLNTPTVFPYTIPTNTKYTIKNPTRPAINGPFYTVPSAPRRNPFAGIVPTKINAM